MERRGSKVQVIVTRLDNSSNLFKHNPLTELINRVFSKINF